MPKIEKTTVGKTLSDLLDNQCNSSDLNEVLDSAECSKQWYRYKTVSEVLKSEHSAFSSAAFCAEISAKIADEPAILASPKLASPKQNDKRTEVEESHSLESNVVQLPDRRLGGFAIAATVAFATFFSVQSLQVADSLNPPSKSSSVVATQDASTDEAMLSKLQELPNTEEQRQLDKFNDRLMLRARANQQNATTAVRGELIGTIRYSAQDWNAILEEARLKAQKAKAEKAKLLEANPAEELKEQSEQSND